MVAYKLTLPEGSQLHPVFHVSLLKKFVGDLPSTQVPLVDDGLLVLTPQAILQFRTLRCHEVSIPQALV